MHIPFAFDFTDYTRPRRERVEFDVAAFDRERVLRWAEHYLEDTVETVTSVTSERSDGRIHDFFSEGDYWWPDPSKPDGPYVRRDGMTNPNNFVAHRNLLMKLSVQAPALASAWKVSGESTYAEKAAAHLRAWFVDETTRMNPALTYAQAIQGRLSGRGIGIVDTVHLVEVARAVPIVAESGALSETEYRAVKSWFSDYLEWLTTSKNGMEERDAKNNHVTCWVLQVAAFAQLTGNTKLIASCVDRFKKVLIPVQISRGGSQPREMARTKPYNYALFNLEMFATLCLILTENGSDLWNFSGWDGRSVCKAVAFMFPYIADPGQWPLPPDVMYHECWPMRHSSLLFAGLACGRPEYIETWKRLPPDSDIEEVLRNFFLRQPVLWV